MQTVFLIGFMGSGKSSFGKELAGRLKLGFVDLDELLVASNAGGSVGELVDKKGLDFFRKAEQETLRSLKPDHIVVSTGGGAPCYFDNLEWMKSRGVVVFLNVEEHIIFSRLSNTDFNERPLLKDLDLKGLKDFIHAKLSERLPYYQQAHITFNPVDGKEEDLIRQVEASPNFR